MVRRGFLLANAESPDQHEDRIDKITNFAW